MLDRGARKEICYTSKDPKGKVGIEMIAQPAPTVSCGIEIVRLDATIRDLENMPDDGYRHELLRGVLYRMPSPKEYHGAICSLIGIELGMYCNTHGMRGQVVDNAGYDFTCNDPKPTVLGPDIAISASPAKGYGPYSKIPPLLAVEVASPSDSHPYLTDKARLFLAAGVQVVWGVWPETQTVDVWTQPAIQKTYTINDILDGGTVFPDMAIPVADIFP
jgi:Uma2 family endonuclease